MHRLFVSLAPDPSIVTAVEPLLHGIEGARWTPPEEWHITLRFIGSANSDRMEELAAVLSSIRFSPFSLTMEGVGTFPRFSPGRRSNVLWVGLLPCLALDDLIEEVEETVMMIGLPPSERPTHPHLTVARLRDANPDHVAQWLNDHAFYTGPTWQVRSIELMDSFIHHHETSSRAEYSTICSIPAR